VHAFQPELCLRIHFYTGWQFFLFLLCPLCFGYDWRGQRFSRFPNTNSNGNGNSNAHGDAYANAHGDAYANAHGDAYANAHGDAYANTYAHAYTITDADTYAISHADSNATTHAHADALHGQMYTDAEAASDSSAASHGASQSHATRSDSSYVHSHACCALDRATACVLPAWLLNPSPPDEKDGRSESRSDFRALCSASLPCVLHRAMLLTPKVRSGPSQWSKPRQA